MQTREEERGKLNILVAIDDMPDPVWEQFRPLVTLRFVRDGFSAYQALTRERFDATFIDLHLAGVDSLELLRRVRTQHLCPAVILTSQSPSFAYAQQGIIYGVSAYLIRPLQADELVSAIHMIQRSEVTPDPFVWKAARAVAVKLRSGNALESFVQAAQDLAAQTDGAIGASFQWRALYAETVKRVFQMYPWLALYHNPAEFEALDYIQESDGDIVRNFCLRKLGQLADSVQELLPCTKNTKMEEILILLLQTIDDNVQQKEVAGRYFITNSTLSTRFQRSLGMSYRKYMTLLKIRRGQYLLRYTDISPDEIAAYLGYKDKEYFSRIFKQQTGETIRECSQDTWGEYSI